MSYEALQRLGGRLHSLDARNSSGREAGTAKVGMIPKFAGRCWEEGLGLVQAELATADAIETL